MNDVQLTDRTRAYYDDLVGDLGEQYLHFRWHANPSQRSHYAQTQLAVRRIFRELGTANDLMEVGCGPGTWTDFCFDHARNVTLFDISEEMLRVVRAKYAPSGRADFVCGDFIANPLPRKEAFDVVFSARAVEYMSDKVAFARRCHEYLKPGGTVAVITKNPGWRDKQAELRCAEGQLHVDSGDDIQTGWISWGDFAEIFRAQGFTRVEAKPVVVGSYLPPLRNQAAIGLCNLAHRVIHARSMRRQWDPVVESYLITARRV